MSKEQSLLCDAVLKLEEVRELLSNLYIQNDRPMCVLGVGGKCIDKNIRSICQIVELMNRGVLQVEEIEDVR